MTLDRHELNELIKFKIQAAELDDQIFDLKARKDEIDKKFNSLGQKIFTDVLFLSPKQFIYEYKCKKYIFGFGDYLTDKFIINEVEEI